MEQKWHIIVAPKSPAQGLCPREASPVQMERGAEKGTLWAGGCSPGSPPPPPRPLTRREMSQRALGSSSLGFLCGFRFCCHLRGQAVCGAAGNNCKSQNQIHWRWGGGALPNAHVPSQPLLCLYLRALCRRNSGGLSARIGGGRDPPGQILQGLTSHPPTPLPRCVHTLTQSY